MRESFLIFFAILLAACAPAAPTPAEPHKFTFWHSMSGANGDALAAMMQRFNAAQTRCIVAGDAQDSLEETLARVKHTLRTNDNAALVQIANISTQTLMDWQAVAPMHEYADRDQFDLSALEPNALAYYAPGGRLVGMPFAIATPILYYNTDAFRAAGLDPDKPPRTYVEVTQAAQKLTRKNADGKVTRYGYSMAISGWLFEQLLATSGALYLDNGNGRDARATKAVFNSPEGVRILAWWKAGFDASSFGNYGRATGDAQKAFDAQQIAMFIDSSASLSARLSAAQGKFEWGTAFLPRPDETAFQNSGVIIGGAAVFILKDRPAWEKNCAWEFVKFFVSPQVQQDWHAASGYAPATKPAYDAPARRDGLARAPRFAIPLEQLRAAPNNRVTQGAFTGALPAARQRVELAIEQVLQGKATPQRALDSAAADVTKLIADYNKTAPGK